MKTLKSIFLVGLIMTFAFACMEGENAAQEESPFHDGIRWTGENETANYLATEGIDHWMNIEFQKAYVLFEKAVELDSSLFAPHTALALLSQGEKRVYHEEMARKFVENENETSKLYVSLLDTESGTEGTEARREIWARIHELSNGPFIHFRYALSRVDTLERITELDNLEAFLDEIEWPTGHLYNVKGYQKNLMGDLEAGTADIDTYLDMYPEGYNPLDSRAEFYLFAGDTAMAIEYYRKTVEKFPYAISARNALRVLAPDN